MKEKKECIALQFKVTETLNNGKERTTTKTVYSPRFRDGKFIAWGERYLDGVKLLESLHYYNIEYTGEAKTTHILWTE